MSNTLAIKPMNIATQEQPKPRLNTETSAHTTYCNKIASSHLHPLIPDMIARQQKGLETYGVPLQPYNGRNHLVDGYQELLDFLVYLECQIRETHDPRLELMQAAIANQALKLKHIIEA